MWLFVSFSLHQWAGDDAKLDCFDAASLANLSFCKVKGDLFSMCTVHDSILPLFIVQHPIETLVYLYPLVVRVMALRTRLMERYGIVL